MKETRGETACLVIKGWPLGPSRIRRQIIGHPLGEKRPGARRHEKSGHGTGDTLKVRRTRGQGRGGRGVRAVRRQRERGIYCGREAAGCPGSTSIARATMGSANSV